MTTTAIHRSRALWNRSVLDLESDEILAQLLDRGELDVWRELYRLAADDRRLRLRILRLVDTVPLPFPHFWRAAMASLGESVDLGAPVPRDDGGV
jgi:hypothetical protein